jgi:hypothetical protein
MGKNIAHHMARSTKNGPQVARNREASIDLISVGTTNIAMPWSDVFV